MVAKLSSSQKRSFSDKESLIFLACLETPRKLWDISKCYNLMKTAERNTKKCKDSKKKEYETKPYNIPNTTLYKKALINNMVAEGALERIPTDKGSQYFSRIKKLFADQPQLKKISDFLEREDVRKELFAIDKIKDFYKNDVHLIERYGYQPFINYVVISIISRQSLNLSNIKFKLLQAKYGKNPEILKLFSQIDGLTAKLCALSKEEYGMTHQDILKQVEATMSRYSVCVSSLFPLNFVNYNKTLDSFFEKHADELLKLGAAY